MDAPVKLGQSVFIRAFAPSEMFFCRRHLPPRAGQPAFAAGRKSLVRGWTETARPLYTGRMNGLESWLFPGGQFLGVRWSVWKVIGYLGNVLFFSRFLVQWYATEKLRRVVVPVSFWWLSLAGSLLLLVYALRQRDSVFILAYLFTWVPYTRNLVIHYRHLSAHLDCPRCGQSCPPQSRFCFDCGTALAGPHPGKASESAEAP